MVFIGEDIEAYLVYEGRETWRVEGHSTKIVTCPACGEGDDTGEGYPTRKVECAHCGVEVELIESAIYRCSVCGYPALDGDDFRSHVESQHPPHL